MGDISAEPSMEDILSSIKRIIAEEGEGTPMRNRRPQRAAAPAPTPAPPIDLRATEPVEDEEVLELSDPMPLADPELDTPVRMNRPQSAAPITSVPSAAPATPAPTSSLAAPSTAEAPQPQPTRIASETRMSPAMDDAEPILSQETAAASRGALDTLSRLLMKPEPGTDGTLEGLVREMLRPMLREWLDANLPGIVETMVAREIKKITAAAG